MTRFLTILVALVWSASLTIASAQTEQCDMVVSVYFAHDRYGLRDESAKLDSVARLLTGEASESHVALYGYASNCGTESYNRRLVARRLQTVKNALVRRGVAVKRIFPIVNNGISKAGTHALTRRVDIAFTLPQAEDSIR